MFVNTHLAHRMQISLLKPHAIWRKHNDRIKIEEIRGILEIVLEMGIVGIFIASLMK